MPNYIIIIPEIIYKLFSTLVTVRFIVPHKYNAQQL